MPITKTDPTGPVKSTEDTRFIAARKVNDFHTNDDVDSHVKSHHHTLGIGRNQGTSGTHTHTGKDSRKTATGAGLVLTGSKGGNVALANLITMLKTVIDFTDNTT